MLSEIPPPIVKISVLYIFMVSKVGIAKIWSILFISNVIVEKNQNRNNYYHFCAENVLFRNLFRGNSLIEEWRKKRLSFVTIVTNA